MYIIGLRHCAEFNYENNATSEAKLDYCHNSTQSSGVNLLSPLQLIIKV